MRIGQSRQGISALYRSTVGELVWSLLAAGGTGLLWWSYAGPYRWLASAQLGRFGSYSASLTALVVFVVFALPGKFLFRGAGEPWNRTVTWSPTGSWLFAVAAVPLAIGMIYVASGRMELKTLTAGMLEEGSAPPSRWLTVNGRLRAEARICVGVARSSRAQECYVPLVSERWSPGAPVAAFLKTRCGMDEVPVEGEYAGTVSYLGLPGPVRAELENGGAVPLRSTLVLDWNEGPESVRVVSFFFIGAGLFAASIGVAGRFPRLTRDWRG